MNTALKKQIWSPYSTNLSSFFFTFCDCDTEAMQKTNRIRVYFCDFVVTNEEQLPLHAFSKQRQKKIILAVSKYLELYNKRTQKI